MVTEKEILSLSQEVGVLLRQRGWYLVTAESCTGGLIGNWITDIPGSSDYYLGGIVAYANGVKQTLLNVPETVLAQFGAVSKEVACAMASGVRQLFADQVARESLVGVGVTGIAGPGGGTPEKPVGLVWIAVETPATRRVERFLWQGDRLQNKALSAHKALSMIREELLDEEEFFHGKR
jgi:nicotinamide-nucleotide amidase